MADSNIVDEDVVLTVDEAKDVLKEMLKTFKEPQNVERIEEAKEKCGVDLLKYMQFVSPVVAQMQIGCIKHYGYSENGQGAIKFFLAVQSMEKADGEISRLYNEVKKYFIPQSTLPSFTS